MPLSANEVFSGFIKDLCKSLWSGSSIPLIGTARRFRKLGISTKVDDSGSSIGKRYARNDELGTSFAVTVDFQTVQDGTVTLRERDTTKQIRDKVFYTLGEVSALTLLFQDRLGRPIDQGSGG